MTFHRLSESVLHQGPLISVVEVGLRGPDGESFTREVVRHPGAVVVVPVTDSGAFVLVRQYRAAVGEELLEVPAGKRDVAGEPPCDTAARELAEEVGRVAGRMDLLARFYNSPGFCDELTHLYLARDLRIVPSDRQGVEERNMAVVEVPFGRVDSMIDNGEIVDAKSIIGLTLALKHLQ